MINADRLGKRAGTRSDAEFAAEEARLLDELLASADLSSPTTPEIRSGDQTSDAETPHGQLTWQAPAAVPQQPEELTVTVAPSAYDAPASAPTFTDTTINADELDELDELRQAWTLGATEPAVEEPKLVDELPASADLSSPTTPEVRSVDLTSDAERAHEPGTWQVVPATAPQQPEKLTVTVLSSAHGAPTDTTTISADEPGELDDLHQTWVLGATELEVEEAKLVDEPPGAVDLISPTTPEVRSIDMNSDAEAPHGRRTWRAPRAVTLRQPEEHAAIVSPSASSTPEPAGPTFTDATPINAGKPGKLDARYRPWTLRDTELAVEETKLVDEPAASSDLSSPTTPEVRSGDQTSDAMTLRRQVTRQAEPASVPQQPEEQAVSVTPSANGAPTSVPRFTDTTATRRAAKPGKIEPRYRPWTLRDSHVSAEEAQAVDEAAVSAEEAQAVDEAAVSAEEAQAVDEAAVSAEEAQVVDEAAVSAEEAQVVDEAAVSAEEAQAVDEAAVSAEEAQVVDEAAVSADLGSPAMPEVRSRDQASDDETPRGQVTAQAATAPQQPEEQAATVSPTAYRAPTSASPGFTDTTMMLGETKKSRRRLRVLVTTLAAVFFVATLGTGFVALKQNKAAGQWRQHDQSEVALDHALLTRNDALSTELVLAHSTVASLYSQTSELNGQIKSLQVQLSSVTNAKATLVNRSALLTQLTKEAGTVSNELSMCVGETNSLQTEIGKDLSNPSHKDPLLQSNTRSASQVCATAQQGNRKLQSTLRGG
jgi:hypothetical protein